MSLVPVPSEQDGAACANCGAALVADQRYCLSCGHPASPVRLAFLDVLQADRSRAASPGQPWLTEDTIDMTPVGYAPVFQQQGAGGWLRRNTGLMGLLSVLLMCLIAGLLVGHWVTQGNKPPAAQIVKIEGLPSGLAAAAPATTTSAASATPAPTSTTSTSTSTKSSAKEEAEAAKEAAKETKVEKAPPKAPVKVAPSKLEKLTKSSGKKHQEEINSLGAQPIETG